MRLLRPLLAVPALLGVASAASQEPAINTHQPNGEPFNLFFFDKSEKALYVDSGDKAIYRSTDAGEKWKRVEDLPDGILWRIVRHPFDSEFAIALDLGGVKHYLTKDQGESWKSFSVEEPPSRDPFSFHAGDRNRILYHGRELCDDFGCIGATWVTTSAFSEEPSPLHSRRNACSWAKSDKQFTTGDDKKDENRILCVVEGKEPWKPEDHKLLISDSYFDDGGNEPLIANNERKRTGITSIAPAKGFIVVSAKAPNTNELSLFTTRDTETWHRALFHDDHPVEQNAYTLLESTNHSIQVDVMTSRGSRMGALFTSNSKGTYFARNKKYTNRNMYGYVDFEKVANIEGIVLVNIVDNPEEAGGLFAPTKKKIKSLISFDAGRSWDSLTVDGEQLHLHSVTEALKEHRSGKIFSTAAPGIVMGIGNTGDYLNKYEKGDLFVSNDAGKTWTKALEEPHMYEMGDQGTILVAIKNNGETDKMSFSKNYGASWESFDLPAKMQPRSLVTINSNSGMKFLLSGVSTSGEDAKWSLNQLDFSKVYEKQCKKADMENWPARVDGEGKATCIMGQKQWYNRRKPDADCYIGEKFKIPDPTFEKCTCTEWDYECDYNFERDDDDVDKCNPTKPLAPPSDQCKSGDSKETFQGPSGWRLMPGNQCKDQDGPKKDEPVPRPCDEAKKLPGKGKITKQFQAISGTYRVAKYLERTDTSGGDDETIVLQTTDGNIQVTRDHGKNWKNITPTDETILGIYQNPYFQDHVYFVTNSTKVYFSHDRLRSDLRYFDAPTEPLRPERLRTTNPLEFHPQYDNWFIWLGREKCPGDNCHILASSTTNFGKNWNAMIERAAKCQFITVQKTRGAPREGEDEEKKKNLKRVFCAQRQELDPDHLDLVVSYDWFATKDFIQKNIVSFATMNEYVVIAARDEEDDQFLKAYINVDGETVAHARFPPKLEAQDKSSFTVLESSTHSLFLHVTTAGERGKNNFLGHILKSNSNGTDFVTSLENVNRGGTGYGFVDFEKMQGLEGVAFVNVVGNPDEVKNDKAPKSLKTKITHNDGADWRYIPPPQELLDGKKIDCPGNLEKCSLHLRNFNERFNPTHSHSSSSAVGLMLATGNVGEHLADRGEGDTYLTRDGGITWVQALSGTHVWEYGDQGSIIVAVKWNEPTDEVSYSINEGRSWEKVKLRKKFSIFEITTVPSDTSTNFLLWVKDPEDLSPNLQGTINLDFSSIFDRACDLNFENPKNPGKDYELWEFKNTNKKKNNQCLFGHISQYVRKKQDVKCFNDRRHELLSLHSTKENCACTIFDYECDYNFVKQGDGSCKLPQGLEALDPVQICYDEPERVGYYEISGYRRNPLTTCSGGKEFDAKGELKACPDHEEEFEKAHGVSGLGVFFAVVLPFALAGGIGYYVWRHWDGKFGQIRLGDDDFSRNALDRDSPLIKWPVAVASGLIAVLSTIPMLVGMTWRTLSSRFGGGYGGRTYTTRSSFARGRGHYTAVDADEGELLGDESEDEW